MVNPIDQPVDAGPEEIHRRLVVLCGDLTSRFARADLDRAIRHIGQERITRASLACHPG